MSSKVEVSCTDVHATRADQRMAELQTADPNYVYEGHEAVDDLLHHGYMLTRLPASEIAPVIARANELLGD